MEWIELGKLGKVSTGNTPSKKKIEYYNENYIELVKPSNFTENMIVNIESGEEYLSKEGKSKGRVAEVGDILVTCIGNIGNVGIVSKEVCFNQQINSIKVYKKKVLSKYIAYAILYIKPALNHVANKAVVPIINKSTFEKMKIPVPPIEIQKQIVEVLDEAQKLIDNRKKQIELLDDLIESIFYDMFGDPVKNDKGWEVKKLGELSSLITKGASPNWQGIEYVDDDSQTLFITSENVREGYLDLSKRKYLQDEFNEKQKRSILKKGDFLINIVGASIGRVAQFNMEVKANINQAVSLVRLENKDIDDKYLLVFLNSESALAQYEKMKVSVARANLSLQNIKDLQIPIPPLPLQNQFAEKVKAIEKQKELLQESLKLMEDNYNSLMQRAFKGELF